MEDGLRREEQRGPARAKTTGERAGIYARCVGVQSLLSGKRERRRVQQTSRGCLGESFLDTRARVFFCFSLFLSEEYSLRQLALFGDDGKEWDCPMILCYDYKKTAWYHLSRSSVLKENSLFFSIDIDSIVRACAGARRVPSSRGFRYFFSAMI